MNDERLLCAANLYKRDFLFFLCGAPRHRKEPSDFRRPLQDVL